MKYIDPNVERDFEDSGIPKHVRDLDRANKYLFSIKAVNGVINIPTTGNYAVDNMLSDSVGDNPTEEEVEHFFDGLTSLFSHIGISEAMEDDFYSDDVTIATETAREIKEYLIDNFIDEGGEDEINQLAYDSYLADWLTVYKKGGACSDDKRITKEGRVLTKHEMKIAGKEGCQYRPDDSKSTSKATKVRGKSSDTRVRSGTPKYISSVEKATAKNKNNHISDDIPKKKIRKSDCTSKQELVIKTDPKTMRKYTACRVKKEYEGYTHKHTNRGRKMSASAIAEMLRTKEKLGLINKD